MPKPGNELPPEPGTKPSTPSGRPDQGLPEQPSTKPVDPDAPVSPDQSLPPAGGTEAPDQSLPEEEQLPAGSYEVENTQGGPRGFHANGVEVMLEVGEKFKVTLTADEATRIAKFGLKLTPAEDDEADTEGLLTMTATVADFRALLPGFEEVPDETIQLYLDLAEGMMGDGWGESGDEAQCFLAAHLMSMAGIGPGAASAQMAGFTKIKAGSVEIGRSEAMAMGGYGSTSYGQIFWGMWKSRGAAMGTGIMVTGTGAPMYACGRFAHGSS